MIYKFYILFVIVVCFIVEVAFIATFNEIKFWRRSSYLSRYVYDDDYEESDLGFL